MSDQEGSAADFAAMAAAARARPADEPSPAEEPATSLAAMRHEAGIRHGLPSDLTFAVQGDDWKAIHESAAEASRVWARHGNPRHPEGQFMREVMQGDKNAALVELFGLQLPPSSNGAA